MCSIIHCWVYGSKDTPLQKKQGYLFCELSMHALMDLMNNQLQQDQEVRKCFVNQKTDHDARFTRQFICLHLWCLFLSLPFWGYTNNHNNILPWGESHYFSYESGSLCTGNYKYSFFLWNVFCHRDIGKKKLHEVWVISPVLRFWKCLWELASLECSWRIFSCEWTKGARVSDENYSVVWNTSKQNGPEP